MIIRIRKKVIYYTLIAFFVIVVGLISMTLTGIKTKEVVSLKVKAQVINTTTNLSKIGVSVDTDELNFGRMIVNKTNMTKIIDFTNPMDKKVVVYVVPEGNVSNYLIYSKKFLLLENEKKSIYLRFYAKDIGNFTGSVKILMRYPLNPLSEWFLVRGYEKGIY